jgi:ribose-phosphate pyrophosphokinase
MDGVVLLADPNSRAWNFAKKIQDHILTEKDVAELPLESVSLSQFKNKETKVSDLGNMRKKEVYFIHDSTKYPQDWLVELLFLKDALLRASAESVIFVLPDLLYSRQDRKDKPHVPISASAVASVISPGLSRLITMDLHAEQVQGFYPQTCPVDSLQSFPEVKKYLEKNPLCDLENLVLVSPDVGGSKRAKAFLQKLKIKNPIAIIYKERSEPGKVEEMTLVGKVKGKDVFIVDDIIDSGGTLCEAAKLLKENGAKNLYCYGTHGIFTKGTEELHANFGRILTSNTHYRNEGELSDIEIVDMSPTFAEAIYRAHKGESISELF